MEFNQEIPPVAPLLSCRETNVTLLGSLPSNKWTLTERGAAMEERTQVLIRLAAATAANCFPCFERFLSKTGVANISQEEIQKAVNLAIQLKEDTYLAIRSHTLAHLGIEKERMEKYGMDEEMRSAEEILKEYRKVSRKKARSNMVYVYRPPERLR